MKPIGLGLACLALACAALVVTIALALTAEPASAGDESPVLKHAQATCIRVSTAIDAKRVSIDVIDNGRGFDGKRPARGNGINNMRSRARAIGGDLLVTAGPQGTTLSLSLPIGAPHGSTP